MIKVLIVDDSPVTRLNLAHILAADPGIHVIGSVGSGLKALDFIKKEKPDVITMDIKMPGMDGFETTRKIMETAPVPIIIVSAIWSPTEEAQSFKAIEAGALLCVPTPPGVGDRQYAAAAGQLIAAVKQMAEVKVVRRWPKRKTAQPAIARARQTRMAARELKLVAVGASTGGPPAVKQFLEQLPENFPVPIVIVQHIAKGFARGFADWLNNSSPLRVYLASHSEALWAGRVYVAPDNMQMGVARGGAGTIELSNAPPEHYLRPSVSYLFRSVAENFGQAAAGVLLTGMGVDGAAELLLIKNAGGVTFVQDKESSVVHGMAGEAIRMGAADHVFPPAGIAAALTKIVTGAETTRDGTTG